MLSLILVFDCSVPPFEIPVCPWPQQLVLGGYFGQIAWLSLPAHC